MNQLIEYFRKGLISVLDSKTIDMLQSYIPVSCSTVMHIEKDSHNKPDSMVIKFVIGLKHVDKENKNK